MPRTKVLWATVGDLPAGWPILSHAHSFYHLFYLSFGSATFLLDGTHYCVNTGDLIIVPPGVLHQIPPESHCLLETYEVKFTVDDPEISNMLLQNGPIFKQNTAFVQQALQYIAYNWATSEPEQQENASTFLTAMLLAIQAVQAAASVQISAYIDTSQYNDLTKRVIRYIEKNHTETFSLEQLAETIGYNKRYLCSAFKRNTSMTILDYLNHVRIRHATTCFYYYDVPISVIAQHVGFITPIHFTRVFKSWWAYLPARSVATTACATLMYRRKSA